MSVKRGSAPRSARERIHHRASLSVEQSLARGVRVEHSRSRRNGVRRERDRLERRDERCFQQRAAAHGPLHRETPPQRGYEGAKHAALARPKRLRLERSHPGEKRRAFAGEHPQVVTLVDIPSRIDRTLDDGRGVRRNVKHDVALLRLRTSGVVMAPLHVLLRHPRVELRQKRARRKSISEAKVNAHPGAARDHAIGDRLLRPEQASQTRTECPERAFGVVGPCRKLVNEAHRPRAPPPRTGGQSSLAHTRAMSALRVTERREQGV